MLAGRIPTELGLLSQLTLLDASQNQLPGAWRGLFADQLLRWQARFTQKTRLLATSDDNYLE